MAVLVFITVILIASVIVLLGALISGALLYYAWNLAVVEVFDGVNDISYQGAFFVMLVLNLIFSSARSARKD